MEQLVITVRYFFWVKVLMERGFLKLSRAEQLKKFVFRNLSVNYLFHNRIADVISYINKIEKKLKKLLASGLT